MEGKVNSKSGNYITYYDNGNKWVELYFINGLREGTQYSWHKNGQLKSELKDMKYQIENYDDFRKNPGKYLGKEINLTPINPSWGGEKITLVAFLDQCLVGSVLDGRIVEKNKVKVNINEDSIKSKSCSSDGTTCSDYAYNLIASIPLNHCRELAPNLSGECRSSYLVAIGDYGGGSMGWDYSYNIYGLFELKDKRKVVENSG